MGRNRMRKKVETKNRNKSMSQRYRRIAEKIRCRKMPVLDKETGEYRFLSEGEEMVRCYDFSSFGEHKYRYVTSLGQVISLKGKTPHFLKQVATKDYLKFGTRGYVHRAVWFSFAYDAIKNKREMPSNYGLPENRKRAIADLKRAAQESNRYVVHHKDGDPQNNRLENLECCLWRFHRALHSFAPRQGETEDETDTRRFDTIHNMKDIVVPSLFCADDILAVEKLSPETVGKLEEQVRIKVLAEMVMNVVAQDYGSEYFQEEKICVINDGQALHYFDICDGANSKLIERSEVVAPMPEYDILYDMPSGGISYRQPKGIPT